MDVRKEFACGDSLGADLRREIEKIEEQIERYLPYKSILSTIRDGLDATKVVSAVIIPTKGDQYDANSATHDFIDVPDWSNRLKAADMGARLRQMYPAERIEHSGAVNVVRIHNSVKANNIKGISCQSADGDGEK